MITVQNRPYQHETLSAVGVGSKSNLAYYAIVIRPYSVADYLILKQATWDKCVDGVIMISLLYLSYNRIPFETADQQVQAIVDKSIKKNRHSDITGALIFTGSHFCQFLEGSEEAVLRLMDTICLDPRHSDIWVVHQEAAVDRRFANWSMAYTGRSEFVSSYLLEIINASEEAERKRVVHSVISMMEEFVK